MKKQEEVLGQIYIIRNNINSKVYIGQTIQGYENRWYGHKHESKNIDRPLYRAMKKYGIDNFWIELIEENIPYEKLDEREIYYIELYDCINPKGYNLSPGGKSFRTEEERRAMAERVCGENNPMYGMNGELNPFYGHHHTEENKQLLSQKHKEHYNNLSQEEKDKIKERLDMAREKMISELGGGFKGHHHTDEAKRKQSEAQKGKVVSEETKKLMSKNHSRKRKTIMLSLKGEFIQEFESITKACEYLKENNIVEKPIHTNISSVCRKERKTAYGYVWVYYEDYINNNYDIKSIAKNSKSKSVMCIDTGKIYPSIYKAFLDTGCDYKCIKKCCEGKYKAIKSKDGTRLKWKYYNEE